MSQIDKKTHRLSKPVAPPGMVGGRKHPSLAANHRGETILVWTKGTGCQRGGALAWQVFDATGNPARTKGKGSASATADRQDGTTGNWLRPLADNGA